MVKIQFSDVVPPEKRSIRDVPIPNTGKRKVNNFITPKPAKPAFENPVVIQTPKSSFEPSTSTSFSDKISSISSSEKKQTGPYEYYYPKNKEPQINSSGYKGSSSSKKFIFGGLSLFFILAFVFLMMTVFSSATISIVPKKQNLTVELPVTASVEANPDLIRYEVLRLAKSETVPVSATGEKMVEEKARGKIIVYNNFSTEPQRLIVRTRFETAEGLIYRIPESINVPGKSIKNGVATPGSVEVEVFADEAGEKFNIKKTDFTIPGFKNDPKRYKEFYARAVTDMTGGFVGKIKNVLPEDKQKAFEKIEAKLKIDLEKELQSKVPEGLVLLPGAISFESKELPQKEDNSSVLIGQEIVAYALLLNREDLSNKIISSYIQNYPDWSNIKASVNNFSELNVSGKLSQFEAGQKVDLDLKGNVSMVASIDTEDISQKVLGIQKRDITKIMDQFPGISSMTTTLRPIWKQSFPENPLKIKIKVDGN